MKTRFSTREKKKITFKIVKRLCKHNQFSSMEVMRRKTTTQLGCYFFCLAVCLLKCLVAGTVSRYSVGLFVISHEYRAQTVLRRCSFVIELSKELPLLIHITVKRCSADTENLVTKWCPLQEPFMCAQLNVMGHHQLCEILDFPFIKIVVMEIAGRAIKCRCWTRLVALFSVFICCFLALWNDQGLRCHIIR